MYCPQCSQQQISDEMRFCSRCGFPLSGVREIMLPQIPKNQQSKAMRGVKQGTFIMLAGVLLTIPTGLLTAADDDFAVLLLLPFACFVVGFLRLLYALFIQDPQERKNKETQYNAPPSISRQATYSELPPPRSVPADAFIPPINKRTAEVVQPASVTENTTKLLEDEGNPQRE